tara:strand:- start:461 stop:880 length:420 start_codon:yes stop_codon:yes gene_type:complete
MENDSNKSNVVVGPWPDSSPLVVTDSNLKKSKKTREQIIEEEMVMVDSLSENIMIQLIQSLKENSVDITSTEFVRDIAFLNESLKSLLFRELGYEHPLSDLSKHIIVPVRSKDKKNIYTKFRGDTVVEILDYLEGIEDE